MVAYIQLIFVVIKGNTNTYECHIFDLFYKQSLSIFATNKIKVAKPQ